MLARPPRPVPLLAFAGFLCLLALVVAGWAPVERLDSALSEAARRHGHEHPGHITVMRIVTDVAATPPYLVVGGAATAVFAKRGHRQRALFCALVTLAVPLLWGLQHWLIPRPRPADGFVTVPSNGFPSGHTSNACAASVAVVLLAWPLLARAGRVLVVLAAALVSLLIAGTRVALLAHWPTDVLGGLLLAVGIATAAARVAHRWTPPDD